MSQNYDLEYKEYVSRMVMEEDRTVSELSRELNISRTTLSGWVQDYKKKVGWFEKHEQKKKDQEPVIYKTPTDYEKEGKEKDKKIERLERENKILEKAMHVFTENHE
jgi:transposase